MVNPLYLKMTTKLYCIVYISSSVKMTVSNVNLEEFVAISFRINSKLSHFFNFYVAFSLLIYVLSQFLLNFNDFECWNDR